MKKNISFLYILFILIIILFFFYILNKFSIFKIESFENLSGLLQTDSPLDKDFYVGGDEIPTQMLNNNCNAYFNQDSFCQFDLNDNKCKCKYQKDEVKYALDSPVPCCDRLCSLLPPEKCMMADNLKPVTYYCNIGGVCQERTATIRNNMISANNCGNDPLTNELLLPYATKEECMNTIDPCDIYNNDKLNESEKKSVCLKDPRCGFCTNQFGEGKCVSGVTDGPLDRMKYFYCLPGQTDDKYKYYYGDHVATLNITQLYKKPDKIVVK